MKTEFMVLSEEERATLRLVKTTPEQADQILDRCQPILAYLKGLPRTLRNIKRLAKRHKYSPSHSHYKARSGCPHCREATRGDNTRSCRQHCAWAATDPEVKQVRSFCTRVPFGGVTWRDAYYASKIAIDFEPSTETVRAHPDYVECVRSAKDWRDELDAAIRHIVGHIEWAHGVKNKDL